MSIKLKYVAGVITGVIGGGLVAAGIYAAYRKQLIDDLTIVKITERIGGQAAISNEEKVKIDIDSKKITIRYKEVDSMKRMILDTERHCGLHLDENGEKYVRLFYLYNVEFKNTDRACQYLGISRRD
jgi:hypothetical protein